MARRPRLETQDTLRKSHPTTPPSTLKLERDIKEKENFTGRIIDIIAPIGKGSAA